MPHLTIEYTDKLHRFDSAACLMHLNRALVLSGHFEEADIKSRAVRLTEYLVGLDTGGGAFIHVTLSILSGRALEVRQELARELLVHLEQMVPSEEASDVQICVEVQEIERASYAKQVLPACSVARRPASA